MAYKITGGIDESELTKWLKAAGQKYGKFKDGRVNYTNADIAPVVMITVACNNEILLAKRGYGLADAKGYWSTVNGFIDEDKSVTQIAVQELKEEMGVKATQKDIKVGKSYTLKSSKEERSYIVFPCLLKLDIKPQIILDREHTDYRWIARSELEKYHILDDLPRVIDSGLKLL